jgi:hypothetical protein
MEPWAVSAAPRRAEGAVLRRAEGAVLRRAEGAVQDGEEDDAPAGAPEYGDLLDSDWLERTAGTLEREEDVVDVSLTLDLDDRDDADGLAYVLDLDVGTLLTSLPPGLARDFGTVESVEPGERELGEGTLAIGALREVLLPEGFATPQRGEDDEEIGDDDQFPAFDASSVLLPSAPPPDPEDGDV